MIAYDCIQDYIISSLSNSENNDPPRTCRCTAILKNKREIRTGLCPVCAIVEAKQRRIDKAQHTIERNAEKKRLLREAREAKKAEIAEKHGEWAARSEYHLNIQLAAKRKQLLKLLKLQAYNLRINESRQRQAAKAAEVALRRSVKEEWYRSNPPRTCKVCVETKNLYDFPKKNGDKHGGWICKKCDNAKSKERERVRKPPIPKVIYTEEQRRAARQAYGRRYRQSEAGKDKKRREKEKNRLDPMKRINRNFSNVVRDHLNKFKTGKPVGGWKAAVGYSLEELKTHLESLFRPGMTWENYGEWHVDHVIPKAAFTFTSADDPKFKECWALDNLQPLWANENSAKRDIYPGNMLRITPPPYHIRDIT